MAAAHPYTASGPDYLCGRCREKLPEGVFISHQEHDGELAWVKAVNGDGDTVHECGAAGG